MSNGGKLIHEDEGAIYYYLIEFNSKYGIASRAKVNLKRYHGNLFIGCDNVILKISRGKVDRIDIYGEFFEFIEKHFLVAIHELGFVLIDRCGDVRQSFLASDIMIDGEHQVIALPDPVA